MTEILTPPETETKAETETETETETEIYPVEPRYHPIHKIPRKIYNFLASAKLAMVLLIVILLVCLSGVTIWRGNNAWTLIFNTLWFNAILVLLVVNVACCFFGRIWGRKITVISFGMILFHLSFVAILLAVVYNSLFYFRGIIRVTEGETLASGDPKSYDMIDKGRFFSFSRFKGDTTLIKMHTGYTVDGKDKRAAYEVAVGEANNNSKGMIYVTHKLTYNGFDYFNDKEGYSLLVTLSDMKGDNQYGGYLPLQSIRLNERSIIYTTGYKEGGVVKQETIPFPLPPDRPRFAMQVIYEPSKLQERAGMAKFVLFPINDKDEATFDKPFAEGNAPIGDTFTAGDYVLSGKEVRYWVGMMVRHEPGKPIVLLSLCMALVGMIITTIGRIYKKRH